MQLVLEQQALLLMDRLVPLALSLSEQRPCWNNVVTVAGSCSGSLARVSPLAIFIGCHPSFVRAVGFGVGLEQYARSLLKRWCRWGCKRCRCRSNVRVGTLLLLSLVLALALSLWSPPLLCLLVAIPPSLVRLGLWKPLVLVLEQ